MGSRREKAANIHRFMCDHPGFGYSWEERYGGPDQVAVEGVALNVGDYDCSSSTITAWRKALEGTSYAGSLDGATYTGNMRRVFVNSGLFDWVPVENAEPGDLYLNESNHVAMCQPDGTLSEFSSNEYGGCYGGERGDQTGWESHVTGYYSYPWDGCLKYNGVADEEEDMYDVFVPSAGAPIHRLFNAATGEHFYTCAEDEKNGLVAQGWAYEGVAWKCPDPQAAVFRMWMPGGKHFFTASFDEAQGLTKNRWKCEGVPFFAKREGTPVLRAFHPQTGDHFLTTDKGEFATALSNGYQDEGTAFYV